MLMRAGGGLMRAYLFLCDERTETECLDRKLVGTTHANAVWAAGVRPKDEVFLYNFHTGDLFGPLCATSTADCHCPGAWRGHFPIQVPVEPTALTRRANARAFGFPLLTRKRRSAGVLEEQLRDSLVAWLARVGSQF